MIRNSRLFYRYHLSECLDINLNNLLLFPFEYFEDFQYLYNALFLSFPVVNENVSLVISRQILSELCTKLPTLPDAASKLVCHFTLERVQPRVISFEEQVRINKICNIRFSFFNKGT